MNNDASLSVHTAATRQRILGAAIAEFAAKDLAGAQQVTPGGKP
jgi:hypothetical protein